MATGNLPENSARQRQIDEQHKINKHKSKCKACKHPDIALIEEDYLTGSTIAQICARWEVERYSIERHFRFYRLRERRDYTSLRMIHRFMDRFDPDAVKIDSQFVLGILKLNAQISGEMAPVKFDGNVNIADHMGELTQNLLKKIGGLPEGASLDDVKAMVAKAKAEHEEVLVDDTDE